MELNRKTYIRYADSPSSINTEGEYTEISEGIEEGSMQLSRIILQGNLKWGEANSSQFQVQIYGISNITGKFIQVRQQDSGKDPVYLFSGFVDSAKLDASRTYRSITAYDALYYYLDLDVTNLWETFWGDASQKDMRDLYQVIYNFYGFTMGDENNPYKNAPPQVSQTLTKNKITLKDTKFSDLLRMLGEITCTVWYVDGYNRLRYRSIYPAGRLDMAANITSNSTFEEYTTQPVTQVKAYLSESAAAQKTLENTSSTTDLSDMETNGLIGYTTAAEGSNNNIMVLTDNYILASFSTSKIKQILSNILYYSRLAVWTPCTLNLIYNKNDVDSTKWLRVTTTDYAGNSFTFTTFALQFNYSGAGLSECTISAAGNQYLDQDKSPYSSGTQAVVNASARVLKELKADVITVDYLEANYITAQKARLEFASIKSLEVEDGKFKNLQVDYLTADSADLKYAKITDLEVTNGKFKNLNVKYVTADMADIDEAGIKKIFAESGIIKELSSGDATITGTLTSVKINADSITAGTLAVDRLILKGSNNSVMYKLNENDKIDTSTVSNSDLQNLLHGENIIAHTITATQIKAKSITANEINVNNISAAIAKIITLDATKITTGYLDSARIEAGSITAEKINTDTLTADMIKSGILKSKTGNTSFNLDSGYIKCVSDSNFILTVSGAALQWAIGDSLNKNAQIYIDPSSRALTIEGYTIAFDTKKSNGSEYTTPLILKSSDITVEVPLKSYKPIIVYDVDGNFDGHTGLIYSRNEVLNGSEASFRLYNGMYQQWLDNNPFSTYNYRPSSTKTINGNTYWYTPLTNSTFTASVSRLTKDIPVTSGYTYMKISAILNCFGDGDFFIGYKSVGSDVLTTLATFKQVRSWSTDISVSYTIDFTSSAISAKNIGSVAVYVLAAGTTSSSKYAAWRNVEILTNQGAIVGNLYTMRANLGIYNVDMTDRMIELQIFDDAYNTAGSMRMYNSTILSAPLRWGKEELWWVGTGGIRADKFIGKITTGSASSQVIDGEITTSSTTSNVTSPSVIDLFDENKSSICNYKITNSIKTIDSELTTESSGQGTITEDGEYTEEPTAYTEFGFIKDGTHPIPKEVMSSDGEGINLYSMASINWKATQELLTIIENLKTRVSELEGKNETSTDM